MTRDHLYQLWSVALVVSGWQLVTGVVPLVHTAILPPPSSILVHTAALLGDGQFVGHLGVTLWRTVLASIAAAAVGIPLGIAMGWNDTAKALFAPLLAAIYPLPVIALLPLLMLLLGSGDTSLVFAAALGGFFLVLWNAMTGASTIRSIYLDVAADNGATAGTTVFREVLLPGALPMILVGVRLCLSTALLIVISAELLVGDAGLGYFLWVSYRTYTLTDVYGTLVVVGLVGVVITYGIAWISGYLVPWAPTNGRTGVDRPLA